MKPRLFWFALPALLLGAPVLRADGPESLVKIPSRLPVAPVTGDARVDFAGQASLRDLPSFFQDSSFTVSGASPKSPWLAAGLSLALPGAGEFYAGSYWKSAAFFVAEVAVWTVAYLFDKKGDRQTDYFQDYANAHWSVVRYGQYAQDNLRPPNSQYAWLIPGTTGRNPWERVNWAELNRMERDIGGYYSHTLPPYGEQQYYELIGKYPQFNQGWDDAQPTFNYGEALTARFLYYADERGKANRAYETASTMVTIALVNHLVSAIDAALTAGSANRGFHAEAGVQTVPTEGGVLRVPALTLRYGL